MARRPDPDRLRKFGLLIGIGPTFAAAVVVGYFLGSWLDSVFGTAPWIMVGGVVLGSAAAFAELVRVLGKVGAIDARGRGESREIPARGAADAGHQTDGGKTAQGGRG